MGFVTLARRRGSGTVKAGLSGGGREIAVFRCGEECHAVSPAAPMPLPSCPGAAWIVTATGWSALCTGPSSTCVPERRSPPAALSLEVFAVNVEVGQVLVDLSGKQPG